MNAVFLDYASLDQDDLNFDQLKALFPYLTLYASTHATEVAARIRKAEVLIINKVVIDADLIKQNPQLKLILITATGTNNVDLLAAKNQQIVVCNCQAYGTASVAQHTMALMLALSTSLIPYHHAVQSGQWNQAQQFCLLNYPIIELAGKTLGIVGYGELGQGVAKLAEAFGMKVLIAALPKREREGRIAFDQLIREVDVLSLHCPFTAQTQDLINRHVFAAMKPTAFLINCARGGIVNEADLAHALKTGQIAGAATDVLSVEPPRDDNVLLDPTIPNLIITPHSAWGSIEARQRILDQVVENVQHYLSGQPIRQVNL